MMKVTSQECRYKASISPSSPRAFSDRERERERERAKNFFIKSERGE